MNPVIKIVGLGGSGSDIVNNVQKILGSNLQGVGFQTFDGDDISDAAFSLGKCDLLLLVAGLGGQYGTRGILSMSSLARSGGCDVSAFVTFPFRFEGRLRGVFAGNAVEELENSGILYNVFSCEKIIEEMEPSGNRTLEETFRKITAEMSERIASFVSYFKAKSIIRVDYMDARRVLGFFGNRLVYMKFKVTDSDWKSRCVADLKSSLQKIGKRVWGAIAQVVHGDDFTLVAYDQLIERIYEIVAPGEEDCPRVLISDLVERSEDFGVELRLWIATE